MATLTSSYQYLGRSEVMKSNNGSLNYYLLLFAKTTANNTTGIHTVTTKGYLASTNANATFYQYSTWFDAWTNNVRVAYGNNYPKSAWDYNGSGESFGGVTYRTYTKIFESSTNVDCTNGLSKTINLGWYYEFNGGEGHSYTPTYGTKRSLYVDVNLAAIPRASGVALDGDSVQMGKTIEIWIYPNSSSFTHTLKYSFGTETGTIVTGLDEEAYEWKAPDLASKFPGKTSIDGKIICETYSDGELIGSDNTSVTLFIPDKSKPRVDVNTVQMGKSVNIYTDRKSTGFTHTLTYTFGGVADTIATGLADATTWTVPDLVAQISGKLSGTCTITCNTYTGSTLVGSATVSLTLTIPDKSTASASAETVQMGKSVDISISRNSKGFRHTLTYSFGGSTGQIASGVETGKTWLVPDMVSKISGKSSETCTITCKTYTGETLVGSDTVSITLTVPDKSIPSASASSVKMGTSVNIYTNRNSPGFTHTLTYAMGTASGTIDKNVQAEKVWTPPKSLASYTGNKLSSVCTITCSTYNGTLLVGSSSIDITLNVPDATVPSLSKTSIVFGESIVISTPREADCYEHDISYTLKANGSSSVALEENFSSPIQEAYEWTPSLSLLAPKIPSATEGIITITCTTRFKGSDTKIGTAAPVSFAVTIPDNETTKPRITISHAPVHALSAAFNGVYVQGKSQVKITYDASSDYSSIASYETKILGVSYGTNPCTSPLLSNEGIITITAKVTDARGYSTEKSLDIDVIPYSGPRIVPAEGQNKIICTRCNSNGAVDPGGVKLLIKIGRNYRKVVSGGSQKNFCHLSYSYKTDAAPDSSYSSPVEILSRTASSDYVSVVLSDIVSSITTAYNIKLIAEDDVGESDVVIETIYTAFASWHVPTGGHGFTLGGYHDPSKYNVFDCLFDAEFEGNVQGKVLGLGKLPEIPANADFNDYKEFGAYSVASNDIARTSANCPSDTSGVLRVWSANGRGDTTGVNVRIMHEYICDDNSATYRRIIQLPDEQSSWDYKDWKTLVFS